MKWLILIFGVIFILTLFNVGESIYRKNRINKIFVLAFSALFIAGLFIPNIQIHEVSFSVSGFVLPILISFIFLYKIKNKKYLLKIIINTIFIIIFWQIYLLIDFSGVGIATELIESIFGILLGIFSLLLCKYPKQSFASLYFGIVFGELIYGLIKLGLVNSYTLTLGTISVMLVGSIGLVVIFMLNQVFFWLRARRVFNYSKRTSSVMVDNVAE